jgi:hypothetical protein
MKESPVTVQEKPVVRGVISKMSGDHLVLTADDRHYLTAKKSPLSGNLEEGQEAVVLEDHDFGGVLEADRYDQIMEKVTQAGISLPTFFARYKEHQAQKLAEIAAEPIPLSPPGRGR